MHLFVSDGFSSQIHEKTDRLGHVIESFGIQIGELTDDERTLEAVMMDMMVRGAWLSVEMLCDLLHRFPFGPHLL